MHAKKKKKKKRNVMGIKTREGKIKNRCIFSKAH